MENSKLVVIFLGVFLAIPVFAYNDKITHPGLTVEAIKLFNQNYPNLKINSADLSQIRTGSIDEDEGNRALKHFYDPEYNRGLTEAGVSMESSKLWSNDTAGQGGFVIGPDNLLAGTIKSYFSGDSDYSWERAIYDYAHGDKARGLQALGHILHLVQDKSVPDHTRNDAHLIYAKDLTFGAYNEDSPYEAYTGNPSDLDQIAQKLIAEGKKSTIYSSLESYFDNAAKYSNNNFFSNDTILDKKYSEPLVDSEKKVTGKNGVNYIYAFSNSNTPLARVVSTFDLATGNEIKTYNLDDKAGVLFPSYWSQLSKQAVLNSAGVIKLFFDEVAREQATRTLEAKNKSWLAKTWDASLALVGLSDKADLTSSQPADSNLQQATTTPTSDLAAGLPSNPVVPVSDPDQKKIDDMYQFILDIQAQLRQKVDLPPLSGGCDAI